MLSDRFSVVRSGWLFDVVTNREKFETSQVRLIKTLLFIYTYTHVLTYAIVGKNVGTLKT